MLSSHIWLMATILDSTPLHSGNEESQDGKRSTEERERNSTVSGEVFGFIP